DFWRVLIHQVLQVAIKTRRALNEPDDLLTDNRYQHEKEADDHCHEQQQDDNRGPGATKAPLLHLIDDGVQQIGQGRANHEGQQNSPENPERYDQRYEEADPDGHLISKSHGAGRPLRMDYRKAIRPSNGHHRKYQSTEGVRFSLRPHSPALA